MRRLYLFIIIIFIPCVLFAQPTLKDGMLAVSKRYGVSFVYDSSLHVNQPFDGQNFKGKSLDSSLADLFNGTGIVWEVRNKHVLLSRGQNIDVPYPEERKDTIMASFITGKMDRDINFTQTGLTKLDGAVFNRGFAVLSSPDVLKTLQSLPGIASGTEMLSNLYVHGGDGSDNLFLIDGVPLYQICHLGGIFSSFNTDIIESVDFYKSGFPARYGGRTSSVVDIATKDGSFDEYRGQFSIGLLDGRVQVEGPIVQGKTSFNMAIRGSWADAIMYPCFSVYNMTRNINSEQMVAGYSFTDVNAKITNKFEDGSALSASLYAGQDYFHYRKAMYAAKELQDYSKIRMSWGNIMASVNWSKSIADNMSGLLKLYWTESNSFTFYEEGVGNAEDAYSLGMSNVGLLDDVGIAADFDWVVLRKHHLRFGVDYIMHYYSPEFRKTNTQDDQDESMGTTDKVSVYGHEASIYIEDEIGITDWLRVNIGLRNTLYHSLEKTWNVFEPRLAVKMQCTNSVSVKASYARMSQFSHLAASTYLDLPSNSWLPSSYKIDPMTSHQVAGGVYARLPLDMHLNIEGWYKTMDNLVEYAGTSSLFPKLTNWDRDFQVGKGRSYGMEVDFGYETRSLSVNAFYTLSWSQRKYDEIYTDWYYDRNDNRHKLTIQANWRLNDKWEFYASWNYHSGNRISLPTHQIKYVNTSGEWYQVDAEGNINYIVNSMWQYGLPNNAIMPDYHRLDVGMNIHIKTRQGNEAKWNVSIYNVYSRLNPIYVKVYAHYGADGYYFIGKGIGIFPIIPSFSYTMKF